MTFEQNIRREQANILYQQSIILFTAILVLVGITLYYFSQDENIRLIQFWAVWIVILTLARMGVGYQYQTQQPVRQPEQWLFRFSVGTLLSGLSWGTLVWIIRPVLNDDILVIVVIYTGMVSGSLVPLSSYLPAYASFSVPMLTSLLYYLLWGQGGGSHTLTGLLLLIYILSMIGFSIMVNRNILATIKLRFSNLDLLEDLKAQKEAAEKANMDKSRFLAATSHDLRQPLHALDLYLEALNIRLSHSEDQTLINKARLSSQALSELLNALMDISRLDAGGIEVVQKTFPIQRLLYSVVGEFEAQAQEKGIKCVLELEPAVVQTDPLLLTRMIRNLVSNAIKHNSSCTLTIQTQQYATSLEVIIKDNGQGIAPSELDNIFSEFYQLNNPERDRSKGLGLGLAIVRRLSQLLDIPVAVDSQPGQGSEFRLRVKLAEISKDELENRDFSPGKDDDLTGTFIFIIDDEEAVRQATRTLLRSWGCEILSVNSEAALMTQLEQDRYPVPDLIISDYRLRDNKTGISVIQAVRSFYQQAIPACIITGDASTEIEQEVRQIQSQLLLKPVSGSALRNMIERVCQTSLSHDNTD